MGPTVRRSYVASALGDGLPEYLDADGNGDGIPDLFEDIGRPCSFEAGFCQWSQTGADQHWERGSFTPTGMTGPQDAKGGTRWAYLEATNGGFQATSELCSPAFSDELESIIWSYHMYGATMGELSVVSYPAATGAAGTVLWSQGGDSHSSATANWTSAEVTLPNGTSQVRVSEQHPAFHRTCAPSATDRALRVAMHARQVCFRGVKSTDILGDMSVDTVYFTSRDSDGDGILDSVEGGVPAPPGGNGRPSKWWIADLDEDGIPNYLDLDR